MRIAIPIWNDKVSPVLDAAARLLIVDVENNKEVSRFEIYIDEQDISRRCGCIRDMAVDILICGAVSRPFLRMIETAKINVIPEIAGNITDILGAYLNGNLMNSDFFMPGCKRWRHCRRNSRLSLAKDSEAGRKRTGRSAQPP